MTDMVKALRRELNQLESELRNDPRLVKIERIKDLLAVYDKDAKPNGPLPTGAQASPPAPTKRAKPPAVAARTKAKDIKAAVNALLSFGTVHRAAILDHLMSRGLMGHEKKPMRQLAAYLSEWRADFKSDGQGNFSLVRARESQGTTDQARPQLPLNELGRHH